MGNKNLQAQYEDNIMDIDNKNKFNTNCKYKFI